jgi:hypothetical protein
VRLFPSSSTSSAALPHQNSSTLLATVNDGQLHVEGLPHDAVRSAQQLAVAFLPAPVLGSFAIAALPAPADCPGVRVVLPEDAGVGEKGAGAFFW